MDIQRLLKLIVSSNHKDRDLAEALVESLIRDEQTETLIQINAQLTGYHDLFHYEVISTKQRVEKKIKAYVSTIH